MSKSKSTSPQQRRVLWQQLGLAAGVIALAAAIIGAVIMLRPDPNVVQIPEQITVDPGKGGDQAVPVIVREYSDFQCPYCKQAALIVDQVVGSYNGVVRFEYNDFPLDQHPYARPAAIAGQCAQAQDKFFRFHDQLFAEQARWSQSTSAAEAVAIFRQYAKKLKLDLDAYDACMTAETVAASIDEDLAEGKKMGVDSTPSFFVNQRRVDMTGGIEPALRAAIDAELQAAGVTVPTAPPSTPTTDNANESPAE